MGMSGVGKTYLSLLLSGEGWFHYSGDLEIGAKYLKDEVDKANDGGNKIVVEDISALSAYVGFLGRGGLPLDEFKRRQKAYAEAEAKSLRVLKQVVTRAGAEGYSHVVHDSTGSFCEIQDNVLLDSVDESSLIIYLKASADEEKEILQRALDNPKPLLFSPEKIDFWIEEFMRAKNLASSNDFEQKEFLRWIVPQLLKNRLPKYQAIADKYGVTIPAQKFIHVKTADDFLNVVREALPDEY